MAKRIIIEEFEELSADIQEVKKVIVDSLELMHEEICELAQLERQLEVLKDEGGQVVKEAVEHYLNQVDIPTNKVWICINDAITAVAHANGAGVKASHDLLPDLFKRVDRKNDLLKGLKK
jgi:2-C-methyl-D-erythritol 4-phosphate cytidylyltransferase